MNGNIIINNNNEYVTAKEAAKALGMTSHGIARRATVNPDFINRAYIRDGTKIVYGYSVEDIGKIKAANHQDKIRKAMDKIRTPDLSKYMTGPEIEKELGLNTGNSGRTIFAARWNNSPELKNNIRAWKRKEGGVGRWNLRYFLREDVDKMKDHLIFKYGIKDIESDIFKDEKEVENQVTLDNHQIYREIGEVRTESRESIKEIAESVSNNAQEIIQLKDDLAPLRKLSAVLRSLV
jgi:hypothetical protein